MNDSLLRMRLLGFAATALATVTLPQAAEAAPTWGPHTTGIEYADYMEGNTRVYAAKIDLCAPGISMRATAPGEGPRTPSSFGQMVGASVAINGDWWSNDGEAHLPSSYPRGLGMGNGQHFPGTVDRPNYGVVAFGPSIAMHSVMEADLGGPHWWMSEVVSGQPTLVWDGQARNNPNAHCGVRRARTAVGFNEDMSTMYMAVVQEVNGSTGMTCNEMAGLMQSMGAYSALNQDGGGSSTMYLEGAGVVNRPSDGQERSLVNHWGVRASSWGPPRHCVTRDLATVEAGVRRRVEPNVSNQWTFESTDIAFIAAETLAAYPEGEPLAYPRLIQHSDSSLWWIDGNTRRHVQSFYAIMTWRLHGDYYEHDKDAELEEFVVGPPIRETPDLFLGENGSVWLLDSTPLPSDGSGDGDGAGNGGDGSGNGDGDGSGNGDGSGDDSGEEEGATSGCTMTSRSTPLGLSVLLLLALVGLRRRLLD